MTQLALTLRLDGAARFETFVAGANRAALAHLGSAATERRGDFLWLWGRAGAGKSHLLQAACRAADGAGRRAMYVPLGGADVGAALLAELGGLDLVALDDVERVAGDAAWERALFALLDARAAGGPSIAMASGEAPASVPFALPDLRSRAGAAAVYRLEPLRHEERLAALVEHARVRGIELEPPVAEYLMRRVSRDMRELTRWLERLDRASLEAQRRLTIPFVRSLLGEEREDASA
ncbi:MAG TPA: DnaA regulatory inactivator Hda [Gammaproteobacteria bacterium]